MSLLEWLSRQMRYSDMSWKQMVESCWPCVSPLALACIRTLLALYHFAALIVQWRVWDVTDNRDGMRFFTNISFLLLFITLASLASLSWIRIAAERRPGLALNVPRFVVCTVWPLWELLCTSAVFLTIVYWTILHDPRIFGLDFINVNVHGINTALVLVEFALNKISFVAFHVVVVFLYAGKICKSLKFQ